MVSEAEHGRLPMLLGLTFQQHSDYDRALRHLQQAPPAAQRPLPARDAYETQL